MRLNHRHGIVSSQAVPFLFYNTSGNVDLLANNRPFTVTIAQRSANYLHSEDDTVTGAWEGPFSPTLDYWLYMEFDTKTFARTFGWTTEAPTVQETMPSNPTLQTTWFDTKNVIQYKWVGQSYSEVNRVFIARMNNRQFYSVSQNSPSFYGTQIGSNQSIRAGRLMFTEYGSPILRDDKTFVTTEDQFFTNQSQVIGVRLEANITTGKTSESLAAYQIVAMDINGLIRTAQYADVADRVIAVVTEDLVAGETGNLVVQGTVTNPAWDFSTMPAGTKLYVDNGELVRTDPHVVNPVKYSKPMVPVAKVFTANSVLFEQGLGGIGPAGPAGSVDNLPPASQSSLGAVSLSVPPVTASTPKVVGDNDPRLSGAPFAPSAHTHSATEVSVITTGNVSAPTVQAAIQELDTEKFNVSGGAISGALVVNGITSLNASASISGGLTVNGNALFGNLLTLANDPISPFEAATKRYVDNLTSGLQWIDPVCLANLIGDDLADPTGLTPVDGDAYILSGPGVGDWAGFAQNDVVRWNEPNAAWVNGGQLNSTNFPELRFLIAGNSLTPARGSFVGREREIAVYASAGATPTYEVPINTNAVYVCNSFSSAAYNQYVYDVSADIWRQTGGSQSGVAADGLTIKQVGSIISTISHADGGTVDASTYRGLDLDTVYAPIIHNHDSLYSPIGHTHTASDITINPVPVNPTTPATFGTPSVVANTQVVGNDVRTAITELLEKKATNKPVYTALSDLPTAASSRGMMAHVLADNSIRVASDNDGVIEWVQVAVNDGTVQNHEHRINYDLTFYGAGPVAATPDDIITRTIVPREITIPANSNIFARVINPPNSQVTFQIFINGVLSSISVTFAPNINGGLFVNGDTGNDSFTLDAGDYIDLVSPTTSDSAITDLALTIVCVANTGTP